MRHSLALLTILVLAGAFAARAEEITLKLDPEVGLRVAYDIEAKGTLVSRGPQGQQAKAPLTFTARRVDVVKEVSDTRITVERTLQDLVLKEDGRTVPLPQAGPFRETAQFDRQGHLIPSKESPLQGLPIELLQALNVVEFIPFAKDPVDVGDTWDASELDQDTGGAKQEKSVSEAELLQTYESDGMQVSLLQQTVDSAFLQPAPEGTPSKGMRISMQAKVLQSNRIEDGCLLGVKGVLSMTMEVLDKDGKPLVSNRIDNLEASLRVVEE
jgi:hypothetical protein